MRYLLIFILLFPFLMHSMAQETKERDEMTLNASVKKVYKNMDTNKWKEINGEWYYKGMKTNLSPIFYTCTVDSIQTMQDNFGTYETLCKKEIINSTGFYQTEKSDWSWNKTDDTWYYKGRKTDTFPPGFTKNITETIIKQDCITGSVSKITIDRKEEYEVSFSWIWDSKKEAWIFENEKTDKIPTYRMFKSIENKSEREESPENKIEKDDPSSQSITV
jgi:hypothetical protein